MRLSLFYSHLVTVDENGFTFRSNRYSWSDVSDVRVWQEPFPGFGFVPDVKLLPRALITLQDGSNIRVRGDALVKYQNTLAPRVRIVVAPI